MIYLRRKIDTYLQEWKNMHDRYPLIVKGPRQVGKTESILYFAKKNYRNIVTINFAEEPKYKTITIDGYSADSIIKNISLIDPNKRFLPFETLIFFDELQEFPDIATSLKFFKIDGRFDIICSGSLLGTHYKKIHSISVGYKTDYEMYSLDFEEFLWAKGYDEHIQSILDHMLEQKPFSEPQISIFNSLFLDYCVLGGMPAIVRSYIQKGTFETSLKIQKQILLDYEEDIRKYAEGMDQTRILNVYNHITASLAKENKKFQISKVAKDARFRDYRGCVEWLRDTGVVNICYCLNFPELPLKGNYDEAKFKIYFSDTGLLIASIDEEASIDLRVNRKLGIYKGALYENFIGEALVKQGYNLYYYKREDSTLEMAFFIRTSDELIPIEVKAGNNRSKSLPALIKNDRYSDIQNGIKFNAGNIGYKDNIHTFPYFCAFLIRRYLTETSNYSH
jgi:predicted AAA+ superfamily ATPase